jgi:hypothetical protein
MNKTLLCSLRHIYFFLFLISSSFVFSQAKLNEERAINIPPGSVMPIKFEFIDYSYKLDNVSSTKLNSLEEKNFLEEFSEEDLIEMKLHHSDRYEYFMKANDFYNSLSNNVKATFTIKELWYIYSFDQQLKNKLITVK